jgi:photosystem II stability/assembly factor-like uncharacterized protein
MSPLSQNNRQFAHNANPSDLCWGRSHQQKDRWRMNGWCLVAVAVCMLAAMPARAVEYGPWRSSLIGGGGYIQNVVPTSDPDVYHSYVDVGGAYRSDDGGRSWRMLSAGLPQTGSTHPTRGLIADPRDPDEILIAVGHQWGAEEGIYRSGDGGETWTKVLAAQFYGNEAHRNTGFILSRHPEEPNAILAGSAGTGVFMSRDNGRTWASRGLEGINPTDLRYDQANPQRVWLSASRFRPFQKDELAGGFFRSDDGGESWERIADEAPTEIVQDPLHEGRIYGIFGSAIIRRSEDGGDSWQDFSQGLPINPEDVGDSVSERRFNALAAGPDFIVTASARGTFYRLDEGADLWRKIEIEQIDQTYMGEEWFAAHARFRRFGAALGSITINPRDPENWFFTDWYGIWQSSDAGRSWELSMDGVEVTVIHSLTQDPNDDQQIHLGMADNGYFYSDNGGERFRHVELTSNMKAIAVSGEDSSSVYGVGNAAGGHWVSNQVFISRDGGRSWSHSPMRGMPDMAGHRSNSIAVNPQNAREVYVAVSGEVSDGAGGVYRSEDGGESWNWMGEGLPSDGFFRDDIWAIGLEIAVSPDGTLAAISRDRREIYAFSPQDRRWRKAEAELTGQPRSVVADPLQPGRFFVGVRDQGVFRSDDGGRSWQRVLDRSVEHVAVDAATEDRLAVGAADTVLLSTNGGQSWEELDDRLPNRVYVRPAFAGDRLIVGTGGNGVFWINLAEHAAQGN